MSDSHQINDAQACSLLVDPSSFPERLSFIYSRSFESGVVRPSLLYQSNLQAYLWFQLHKEHSPAYISEEVHRIYQNGFDALIEALKGSPYSLSSFGCGGGNKEHQFMESVHHLPVSCQVIDASGALAIQTWSVLQPFKDVQPIVADLEELACPPEWSHSSKMDVTQNKHVLFYFGMLPNMDSEYAWTFLSNWARAEDLVLLSANLVSRSEATSGLPHILPQYDNELTRNWLSSFLNHVGVFDHNINLQFSIINQNILNDSLPAIQCFWKSESDCEIFYDGNAKIVWPAGRELQLFKSLRYSINSIYDNARAHGFEVIDYWHDSAEQEGVFLLKKGN